MSSSKKVVSDSWFSRALGILAVQRLVPEYRARLAMGCLLVMTLSACTSQLATPKLEKQSPEAALLDQLAALVRADAPRVDLDALSTLVDVDVLALVQEQQKATTASDGAINVTKGIADPDTAVTAVTYRLTPAGTGTGSGQSTAEQVILVLNPLVACVTEKAIQQQWGQAMQSGLLGALRYGPGGLWPMDGLHRNTNEHSRRGNGPIEVIVSVTAPSGVSHVSSFRFTHEYWQCARSVMLERRF